VFNPAHRTVCRAHLDGNKCSRDEALANARLIAAAPELFEALADLMENPQFVVSVGGNPNMVATLLDRARAALAKARGDA
jgi:hypothetical protein